MDGIMVIDAGTSGLRAIIFSLKGKTLTSSYEEYKSIFPHPVWVEQNATNWWQSLCRTVQETQKNAMKQKINILGVSVTNQRETIVPVNESGFPLRNAIVWQDRRTTTECQNLHKQFGAEEIYNRTGLTIDPYFSASKIAWITNNQPRISRSASWFFLVHDYLVYKLTNTPITDWSNASRTMLFDIRKRKFDPELCEAVGISVDQLPDPVPSGNIIGEITASAAKATGLEKGTPVVSGGGDQQCAAVGVGVISPGKVKVTTGTGSFILGYAETPIQDSKRRLLCSCHAVPKKYVIEASIFTTGSLLRWIRDQVGAEEVKVAEITGRNPYDVLCEEADSIPPGSDGVLVLPHFVGAGAPFWNPSARGAFFGLALGHTRAHLIRAVLEAVYYEVKRNLDIMNQLGLDISEIRLTGGGARNKIWNQIAADICQTPIWKGSIEDATALGSAVLTAKGIKYYKTIEQAVENLVHKGETFTFNPKLKRHYDNHLQLQYKIYTLLEQNNIFDSPIFSHGIPQ